MTQRQRRKSANDLTIDISYTLDGASHTVDRQAKIEAGPAGAGRYHRVDKEQDNLWGFLLRKWTKLTTSPLLCS